MQAIISDIIVNQAAQSGNLQISQLTKNNSSSQTSFLEMLNTLRSQEKDAPENEKTLKTSYDDKKPNETTAAEKDQKSETAQKSDETKALDANEKAEKKDAPETENQKSVKEDNSKKVSLQKNDDGKPKLLNDRLQVAQEKGESKEIASNEKSPSNAKNIKKDFEIKSQQPAENEEEITATENLNQNAAAIQNASSINTEKSDLNVKVQTEDKDGVAQIETGGIALSQNQDELLQNKLTADEKVYALDKDSKIIVHDQRSQQPETKPSEKNNSKAQLQVQYDSQNNATVTMKLAEQNASENILSLDNQTAAAEGSNFQAMLNNQIQANAPEFVKAGSLILQDNNKGTINLVLHPDDLGNVKIHLSMDGKTVSAHITVNTKEALEVFKDNAQTLREAFAKNGYETSNFDVSYNGNSQGGNNQEFEGRYDGIEYMARKVYNESLGGGNDGYIPDSYEFAQNSEYSINIVA